MPTIEELDARLTALEKLCNGITTPNDDIKLNGFIIRYVVLSADNKRILTNTGFKSPDNIKDSTFKLFTSTSQAREYVSNHSVYHRLKTKIVRVKIVYEFLNDVIERNKGGDFDE